MPVFAKADIIANNLSANSDCFSQPSPLKTPSFFAEIYALHTSTNNVASNGIKATLYPLTLYNSLLLPFLTHSFKSSERYGCK